MKIKRTRRKLRPIYWWHNRSRLRRAVDTPLEAPSMFTATGSGSDTINFEWQDNSDDETGFVIEQSLDGETGWAEVLTPAANSTTAQITGLDAGIRYYFRIKAVKDEEDSEWSDTASEILWDQDELTKVEVGAQDTLTGKYLEARVLQETDLAKSTVGAEDEITGIYFLARIEAPTEQEARVGASTIITGNYTAA